MDLQIEDAIFFHAIFKGKKNYPFSLNVLLMKFSQPLIWELTYNNDTYLLYLLQDKTLQGEEGWVTIQELLFSKASTDAVSRLVNSELSISDAFFISDKIWRVGKIGNKIYPRKLVKNYQEIKDRFPRQGITLKDVQSI
ncbi:hypothetical protein [Bacillus cereus group sp. BfR-BA-01328]|uniref:hypothetical protein n=1 Tax=Bacillus cereus group sp. BfR-BA-01328 TaxID=2920304 RepID=UPI001F56B078